MFKLDAQQLSSGGSHVLFRGAPLSQRFVPIRSNKGSSMQIKQVMSEPVFVCSVNENLSQAAQLMWEHDCGVVAIVDSVGQALAMLTDRDICMAAYTQGKPLSEIPIPAAMSRRLITCRPEESIEQAEELMSAHQIRRLVVIDTEGMPVGMLALNDLARTAAGLPQTRVQGATNGIRMTATARTLAAVGAVRQPSNGTPVA
jgi:CBS domain-containing protein